MRINQIERVITTFVNEDNVIGEESDCLSWSYYSRQKPQYLEGSDRPIWMFQGWGGSCGLYKDDPPNVSWSPTKVPIPPLRFLLLI